MPPTYKIMNYNCRTGDIFPFDKDKYFSKKKEDRITNEFYLGYMPKRYTNTNIFRRKSKYLSREDLMETENIYEDEYYVEDDYSDIELVEEQMKFNNDDCEFDQYDELNSNL